MRRLAAVALSGALAFTATACLSSDDEGGDESKTVTVWTSMDQPVVDGIEEVLIPQAKEDGITVKMERVENINQLIMTKIQANDAPDIAMIPQPGVVKDIVSRDAAYPINDVVDMDSLTESMVPGTLEAGTVDDELYGLLVSMNIKSLVFYNKPAFEAEGYAIPTTIEELNALTKQIKADGNTPWCMGIESDTATGWPATDWFEDLIMRYGGADAYNQWVTNEVKFDSDVVREAAAEFEELMFTEGNVLGGRDAISSTNFGTGGNPMFDKDPGCYMYKQGSFITGFFPDSVTADLDANVGVFGFPPPEGGENPVLGGGDLAVLMSDSDAAGDVMAMLSETDIGVEAAPSSSFISPHKDFDLSLYPTELTKQVAQVGYDASVFLFDGSDQMPGEVGAGSFWKEMTAWISGDQDLDTTLKKIDDSWPS
jgi:alpha-glucoside transport system substrate-binding protein